MTRNDFIATAALQLVVAAAHDFPKPIDSAICLADALEAQHCAPWQDPDPAPACCCANHAQTGHCLQCPVHGTPPPAEP